MDASDEITGLRDHWTAQHIAELLDRIEPKQPGYLNAREAGECIRSLTAERYTLCLALYRESAAHAQTRRALVEANARWQALLDAKAALSGIRDRDEEGRTLSGPESGVLN